MVDLKVPFVDLTRQFLALESELTETFLKVGKSGSYIMGEYLESFEQKVAEYCGVSYAIGVANGTDALFLPLKAMGVGSGDEVITATNSFIASAGAIAATGAKPVLVDVQDDMNIDVNAIERAINQNTKVIMPVHLSGRPSEMDEINDLAKKYNLIVLEDAAQSMGAKYKGRPVGSLGDVAGFSLHPLKNLGVYGDGGVITTNDSQLDSKLRKLRNHGLINRDKCKSWGFNSRLDSMQAAFAEIKLAKIDSWNLRCVEIAGQYREGLSEFVQTPYADENIKSVYHNFIIRTKQRDSLIQYLESCGIGVGIHYPIPIHLQEASHYLGYKAGDLPNAERFAKEMVSLPIYPELTDNEVDYIINTIIFFYKEQV